MKILILGGSGMLGHKLYQVLTLKFDTYTTIRGSSSKFSSIDLFDQNKVFYDVDVLKFDKVKEVIENLKPDVVINAIGVIKQKKDGKNIIKNIEINALFPHKVANITESLGSRFITFSTDCVFDGKKGLYRENELANALDIYGKTKRLGEVTNNNCLTLRTSIIGRELKTTNSLVEWFLNEAGRTVKGFSKAIYSGFPTIVLAKIVADIIENKKDLQGLYHLSSTPINKFDLLKLIKKELDLNIEIEKFEDFKIDRSLDSSKFRNETGFTPKDWKLLIQEMFNDPTPYEIWRKILTEKN